MSPLSSAWEVSDLAGDGGGGAHQHSGREHCRCVAITHGVLDAVNGVRSRGRVTCSRARCQTSCRSSRRQGMGRAAHQYEHNAANTSICADGAQIASHEVRSQRAHRRRRWTRDRVNSRRAIARVGWERQSLLGSVRDRCAHVLHTYRCELRV